MSDLVCREHVGFHAVAMVSISEVLPSLGMTRLDGNAFTGAAYVRRLSKDDPDFGSECEEEGCENRAEFRVGPM
jgi:hypothetical protein